MRVLRTGLIGLGIWSIAAGASAQIPTSTADIIPSTAPPTDSDVSRSDAAFRELIGCVVERQPARARNLLQTIPGSREEAVIIGSFHSRMESCFNAYRVGGRALMIHGFLVRGAIAETLYREEFPSGLAEAPFPAPQAAAGWVQPRPEGNQVTQAELVHAMARCVIVRRPAQVKMLMATPPMGPGEIQSMRALQGDLSECLDSGVAFDGSRQALRSLLAEAALHFARSQRRGFDRVADETARSE